MLRSRVGRELIKCCHLINYCTPTGAWQGMDNAAEAVSEMGVTDNLQSVIPEGPSCGGPWEEATGVNLEGQGLQLGWTGSNTDI